jgi:DNA-binding beta-propeller fold protein YncE
MLEEFAALARCPRRIEHVSGGAQMTIYPGARGVIAAVGVTLLLFGCAQTASQTPETFAALPADSMTSSLGEAGRAGSWSYDNHSWFSPEAAKGKNLLYVLQEFGISSEGAGVYIFKQKGHNQKPIGFLDFSNGSDTELAGLAVDATGTLYVGDTQDQIIWEIPKGKTKPKVTLTGADNPLNIIVGKDGTVYVANQGDQNIGNVMEYAKGSTMPTRTIKLTGNGWPWGMALDAANNLYVAYNINFVGHVFEVPSGSSKGTDLNLDNEEKVAYYGLAIDKKGKFLYVSSPNTDSASQQATSILEFRLPDKQIYRSIGSTTEGTFTYIALNASQTRFWVINNCCGGMFAVDGFSAPAGVLEDTLDIEPEALSLSGIAADPVASTR